MTIATTNSAIAIREERSAETQIAAAEAAVMHEIQGAMILARKFPRDERDAFLKLIQACRRPAFAEASKYSYPRGNTVVEGPSVHFAREAARIWGNIRSGIHIVRDDDRTRQIRAWAWDVETNVKCEQDDTFSKLILRKSKGVPDERELRELTNRRSSIAVRNCILHILPRDLVEDAMAETEKTVRSRAIEQPGSAIRDIAKAFGEISVSAAQIAAYLGHPLEQITAEEITELRKVFAAIRDGQATWAEYARKPEATWVDL